MAKQKKKITIDKNHDKPVYTLTKKGVVKVRKSKIEPPAKEAT